MSATPAEPLRRLEQHLRRHHHVIDSATLRALGFGREYARSQVAGQRWQRVHRGIFCGYTGQLTFESRCEVALRCLGPDALLDGPTAAQLHGLRRFEDHRIHIVIPHGGERATPRGVVLRRVRGLIGSAHQVRRGMPVVGIDVALLHWALARPQDAGAVLTAGVQQGLTTASRLHASLEGMGRVRHRRKLISVIADIDGGSRSELERRFLTIVRRARLPKPVCDYPVWLGDRRVWVDVCYPELRIAIEIDGRAFHLMSEDWEDDLDRQNDIVLDDWLVLRFTSRAIREHPHQVAERVARAIGMQSRGAGVEQERRTTALAHLADLSPVPQRGPHR